MMKSTCQVPHADGVCGRPTGDNAYVCSGCARRLIVGPLELLLAAGTDRKGEPIPGLLADLDDQLRRDTAHADQVKARAAETPVPFDPRASEAAWILQNTLTTWVRLLSEERSVVVVAIRVDAEPLQRAIDRIQTTAPLSARLAAPVCEHTDLPKPYCAHCRKA